MGFIPVFYGGQRKKLLRLIIFVAMSEVPDNGRVANMVSPFSKRASGEKPGSYRSVNLTGNLLENILRYSINLKCRVIKDSKHGFVKGRLSKKSA